MEELTSAGPSHTPKSILFSWAHILSPFLFYVEEDVYSWTAAGITGFVTRQFLGLLKSFAHVYV